MTLSPNDDDEFGGGEKITGDESAGLCNQKNSNTNAQIETEEDLHRFLAGDCDDEEDGSKNDVENKNDNNDMDDIEKDVEASMAVPVTATTKDTNKDVTFHLEVDDGALLKNNSNNDTSLKTFNTSESFASSVSSDEQLYDRRQRCSIVMVREQCGQILRKNKKNDTKQNNEHTSATTSAKHNNHHTNNKEEVHTAESLHEFNDRIPFYAPPIQRQRWGETQVLPHVNWGDLFFDLFYVGAAYNLGVFLISIVDDGTPQIWPMGLMYYIGIFGCLFTVWSKKTQFDAKYTVVDYVHRLVEIIRVCFLALSIMHIEGIETMRDPTKVNAFNFMLGLTLEQFVTLLGLVELHYKAIGSEACRIEALRTIYFMQLPPFLLYVAALAVAGYSHFPPSSSEYDSSTNYVDDSSHRHLNMMLLRGLAGSSTSSTKDGADNNNYSNVSSFSIKDLPFLLIFLGYIVNQVMAFVYISCFLPSNGQHKKVTVPMNVDFTIHRYGEWTMLMLGESVLSLLIVETVETRDYYIVAFVGIITVIMLQALHFESEPSHANGHAMRRSKTAGICFYYIVQTYSMALIVVGASYKVMLQIVYYSYSHSNDYNSSASYNSEGSGYEGSPSDYNTTTNSNATALISNGDDPHRHRYLSLYHRFLAGASGIDDSTEIKQISSNMFALGLMVCLISLELMTFVHKGWNRNKERCLLKCWKQMAVCWTFLALKLGLILVTATLSLWCFEPHTITLAGMIVVFFVICLRVAGWELFNNRQGFCHTTLDSSNRHNPPVAHSSEGERNKPQSLQETPATEATPGNAEYPSKS